MVTTHPATAREALTITPTAERDGADLVGDIDLATMPAFEAVLDRLVAGDGCGDVHLGLAGLQFVDLSGAAVLVAAAAQLGPGRTLVLRDPTLVLCQILYGFWNGVIRTQVNFS